jgi:hypothetical protein
LFPRGYYSSSGTSYQSDEAVPIEIKSAGTLNMPLLKSMMIAGIIKLPDNETAPTGGITTLIYAQFIKGNKDNNFYQNIKIEEGYNSKEFSVTVPFDDKYITFRLFYDGGGNVYQKRGYLSKTTMTSKKENADVFDINDLQKDGKKLPDLTLQMIKGAVVSGVIKLPDGMTSPKGGMIIKISYYKGSIKSYWHIIAANVKIPEGKNKTPFKFVLSGDDVYDKTFAFCLTTDATGYVPKMFYAKDKPASELAKSRKTRN